MNKKAKNRFQRALWNCFQILFIIFRSIVVSFSFVSVGAQHPVLKRSAYSSRLYCTNYLRLNAATCLMFHFPLQIAHGPWSHRIPVAVSGLPRDVRIKRNPMNHYKAETKSKLTIIINPVLRLYTRLWFCFPTSHSVIIQFLNALTPILSFFFCRIISRCASVCDQTVWGTVITKQ